MKKIYIAGKLNGEACGYLKNVRQMIIAGNGVKKLGFSVFIPGIDLLWGVVTGDMEYNDYFDNSQSWLEVSDAMFVQGDNWEKSSGTLREIETAKRLNIPIFFELDKLVEYFKDDKNN